MTAGGPVVSIYTAFFNQPFKYFFTLLRYLIYSGRKPLTHPIPNKCTIEFLS